MWYGLLVGLFSILCIFLILIILIQKTKGGMGLGNMGGGTQMLFGGSGGQDLFQKVTWVMAALFMGGSLLLAMIKRPESSNLLGGLVQKQDVQATTPVAPSSTGSAEGTKTDAAS
ncbi:preprotein translocase subunit SecG [Candidatus Dependentiae bacterium]|nr:preprotein translocase subunit SecG [Candidatus Dependentiae bacterium]